MLHFELEFKWGYFGPESQACTGIIPLFSGTRDPHLCHKSHIIFLSFQALVIYKVSLRRSAAR